MGEQKTTLPFLQYQDWENVKVETKKVNTLWIYFSEDNITELNELICPRAELISDRINIF